VTLAPSLFGQVATEAALEHGGPWLAELRGYLDAGADRLDELVSEHLPDVRWTRPEGTYLAWLDCRALGPEGDEEVDPATAFLERGRVALGVGTDFGPERAGHVRLTAAVPRPLLEEVVRLMASALPHRQAGGPAGSPSPLVLLLVSPSGVRSMLWGR